MFYGAEQAAIHDREFGKLAAYAAADLLALLRAAGITTGTIVDLGCGSGILAQALVDAGYDVLGVDISPDMIEIAQQRAPAARFSVGSLHDFPIPDGCVAVTAIGEALNYAVDPRTGLDAVGDLARRAHAAMYPGGVMLLDVAGPGRAGPSGVTKQFHDHDDWSLGMTTTEAESRTTLDRRITIFTADSNGCFRRVKEHHKLRLYDRADLVTVLAEAGLVVDALDDYESVEHHPGIPGWYVLRARKPGG